MQPSTEAFATLAPTTLSLEPSPTTLSPEPSPTPLPTATPSSTTPPSTESGRVTRYSDLAYGPADPGNLLDLYVPDRAVGPELPLIIWHTGSGWGSNAAKDFDDDDAIVAEFAPRGFAVAVISIRSSSDARFPAQGFDVRAAIRYLRENAASYALDPDGFAFLGNSSGGWAAAFAAMTSDDARLEGERGVDGTSSAVQVAVPFYPPTDLLSIDAFAVEHQLPMSDLYPFDSPTSIGGLLIHCPGEGPSQGPVDEDALVSFQECPDEAARADPTSYVDGGEAPTWLLHGSLDPDVAYNQSQLLHDATSAAGNEARLTLVPGAGHAIDDVIDAAQATTWTTDAAGEETETAGRGPSWDDIAEFIADHLD